MHAGQQVRQQHCGPGTASDNHPAAPIAQSSQQLLGNCSLSLDDLALVSAHTDHAACWHLLALCCSLICKVAKEFSFSRSTSNQASPSPSNTSDVTVAC